MKYKMLPIHIHELLMPDLGGGAGVLSGKIHRTIFSYPVKERKNLHEFRIDWKYRVSKNGDNLFSFIGESKFIIQDDNIPFNNDELDRFIKDLYLNFEIGWEEKTKNTRLKGTTIANLHDEDLINLRNKIIDMMK